MYLFVLERIALGAALDILFFPIWWYSIGAKTALFWCFDLLKNGNARMAPGLWLKNIFVPMYGQYDWQGKIISFFMRFAQVIFRSAVLLVWLFFCFSLFLFWLILPGIVVWALVWSIGKI